MLCNNQGVTVTEEELLYFFESEPRRANQDSSWFFDDSVYQVEKDGFKLSFAIQSHIKDVRLILFYKNLSIYEFNATSVQDVEYYLGGDLIVKVNDIESINIALKSSVNIQHHYKCLLHQHE